MDGSEEFKREEWIFEENTMEIQTLKVSEIYIFNEYLIEIIRTTNGKEYYVKVYELVASGAPYGDPQTALKAAIRFLEAHPVR